MVAKKINFMCDFDETQNLNCMFNKNTCLSINIEEDVHDSHARL